MKKLTVLFLSLSFILLFSQQIYINEFMADNNSTIEDPDEPGAFEDWIEIYNSTAQEIDLGGMYMTDDLTNLMKWQIPDGVTIEANGFLLIWADNDPEQGDVHTNFKLSSGGEEIGLIASDGSTIIDSYTFGSQNPDISEGRYPDGGETWQFMSQPTPGSSNVTANNPPQISDLAQNPLNPTANDDVNIVVQVSDDEFVSTVYLKINDGNGYNNLIMWDDGSHGDGDEEDGIYGCFISAEASGTHILYYVEATDNQGAVTDFPSAAPDIVFEYEVDYQPPSLFINEFMADNGTTISDPQGQFDDWIEIYNASDEPFDLAGLYFTDNFSNQDDWWQISAEYPDSTTVPANGFLLLWADNDITDGIRHLNFKLSGGGEEIGIFAYYGSGVIDTISFGEQTTDVSYGRFPDGSENWIFMNTPSPGNVNTNSEAENSQIEETSFFLNSYPNPFRTSTTISYNISRRDAKNAKIVIYNLKGQKVKELVILSGVEGNHSQSSIVWNGKDNFGKPVNSGIYYYRLSCSRNVIGKMILIK